MTDDALRSAARAWRDEDPDPATRAEVDALLEAGDLAGLRERFGARFVDLTDLYSPRLRKVAQEIDPSLEEGVYAGLPGPQYETPAEIRMLQTLGADLVGMSTVHETIAARHMGAEVLGLSLVTNLAAGLGGANLDHADVLEAGASAAQAMGDLLAQVVARL